MIGSKTNGMRQIIRCISDRIFQFDAVSLVYLASLSQTTPAGHLLRRLRRLTALIPH